MRFICASKYCGGVWQKSNLEFAHFFNIALGSANESEYLILLAKDLKYITLERYETLNQMINEVKGMLISLITKVRA